MRSLQVSAAVRLFLALWLAITPTFVWAGSMTLLGVGAAATGSPISTPILAAGGSTSGPSSTVANYGSLLMGGAASPWSANTTQRVIPSPIAGSISTLNVRFPLGAGAAGTYAISLRKNGANSTLLTCTVPNSGTTCTSSGVETIAVGDLLGWQVCPGTVSGGVCTTGGTQTANAEVQISAVFSGTNNNESFLLAAGATGSPSNSIASYMTFGGFANYQTSEASSEMVSPTNTTIDDLFINSSAAPGASKFWVLTVFQNGAATSLQCSLTGTGSGAGITQCNDTNAGHALTIATGDRISVELCPQASATYSGSCTPGGTPTAPLFQASARSVPTIQGETIVNAAYSGGAPSNVGSRFDNLSGGAPSTSTESQAYNIAPVGMTVKKLRAWQQPQPGAGVTRSYTLRANVGNAGSPSALSCTVSAGTGATGTCSDSADNYGASTNDLLDFNTTPTGTNAAITALSISAVVTIP